MVSRPSKIISGSSIVKQVRRFPSGLFFCKDKAYIFKSTVFIFWYQFEDGVVVSFKFNNIKMEKGMIVSNEPGYYEKDKFGIRIENLIYINKIKNKLKFENLTLAPMKQI